MYFDTQSKIMKTEVGRLSLDMGRQGDCQAIPPLKATRLLGEAMSVPALLLPISFSKLLIVGPSGSKIDQEVMLLIEDHL